MLKRYLVGALVALTALVAAAVVSANPTSDSTWKVIATGGPFKPGTKAKPKPSNVKFVFKGGTKSGSGQPETSTDILIVLPSEWKWRGKIWPTKQRCKRTTANTKRSDKSCPRGSLIGKGTVDVLGIGGTVKRTYDIRAYVLTNGTLGVWVQTRPGVSPIVNRMLGSKISGRNIKIHIDQEVQEPVTGINTGITNLSFTLKAKAKVKGKRRGVLENVGCKTGKWPFKVTSFERTGKLSDTSTVKCKKG